MFLNSLFKFLNKKIDKRKYIMECWGVENLVLKNYSKTKEKKNKIKVQIQSFYILEIEFLMNAVFIQQKIDLGRLFKFSFYYFNSGCYTDCYWDRLLDMFSFYLYLMYGCSNRYMNMHKYLTETCLAPIWICVTWIV